VEEIFLPDVIFGFVAGVLAFGMFYSLSAYTDRFGMILGGAGVIGIEAVACNYCIVSGALFVAVVIPGCVYMIFEDGVSNENLRG
jgi:hypothetical protein